MGNKVYMVTRSQGVVRIANCTASQQTI